jgi:hypothetical protein
MRSLKNVRKRADVVEGPEAFHDVARVRSGRVDNPILARIKDRTYDSFSDRNWQACRLRSYQRYGAAGQPEPQRLHLRRSGPAVGLWACAGGYLVPGRRTMPGDLVDILA